MANSVLSYKLLFLRATLHFTVDHLDLYEVSKCNNNVPKTWTTSIALLIRAHVFVFVRAKVIENNIFASISKCSFFNIAIEILDIELLLVKLSPLILFYLFFASFLDRSHYIYCSFSVLKYIAINFPLLFPVAKTI